MTLKKLNPENAVILMVGAVLIAETKLLTLQEIVIIVICRYYCNFGYSYSWMRLLLNLKIHTATKRAIVPFKIIGIVFQWLGVSRIISLANCEAFFI